MSTALSALLSLVGRVLMHRMDDSRSQRIGSWTWTVLLVLGATMDDSRFWTAPAAACAGASQVKVVLPILFLALALVNGSHGLGFVHKTALIGTMLVYGLFGIAACSEVMVASLLCGMGACIVGFVLAHMAEMHLRHSYAESERKRRLEEENRRRLEERNEQLQVRDIGERWKVDGKRDPASVSVRYPIIYLSIHLYPGREGAPALRHAAAPWPRGGRRTQRHPPRPAGGAQSRHERSNLAAILTAPLATTWTSLQHVQRVQHVRSVVRLRHQLGGRRPTVARP